MEEVRNSICPNPREHQSEHTRSRPVTAKQQSSLAFEESDRCICIAIEMQQMYKWVFKCAVMMKMTMKRMIVHCLSI